VAGVFLFSVAEQILVKTANDPDDLDEISVDFDWERIKENLARYWILAMICFAPSALTMWMPGLPALCGPVFTGMACLYFPMALLGVAMFETLAVANPVFVIGSIFRAPAGYWVVALFFAALVFSAGGSRLDPGPIPPKPEMVQMASGAVLSFVGYYLALVWIRLLGLFYRHYREDLAWSA
jgi:hypothetical protein